LTIDPAGIILTQEVEALMIQGLPLCVYVFNVYSTPDTKLIP